MSFADRNWCQEELDRVIDLTEYVEKREIALTPVYETLSETKRRSECVEKILKDTMSLMENTRHNYLKLLETEPNLDNPEVQSSGQPNAHPGQTDIQHDASGPTKPVEKQRAPGSQNMNKTATNKGDGQLPSRRIAANAEKSRRSVAPTNNRRVTAGTGFKSKALARRNTSTATIGGINSRLASRAVPLKALAGRTRIRHNENYPKPWLDPPPKHPRNRERRETVSSSLRPSASNSQSRRMSSFPQGGSRPVQGPTAQQPTAPQARRISVASSSGAHTAIKQHREQHRESETAPLSRRISMHRPLSTLNPGQTSRFAPRVGQSTRSLPPKEDNPTALFRIPEH